MVPQHRDKSGLKGLHNSLAKGGNVSLREPGDLPKNRRKKKNRFFDPLSFFKTVFHFFDQFSFFFLKKCISFFGAFSFL